uniref:Uncharacterized protein n=1 Tax=Marseillevirus sp. TaxID=2809551 RepID=A0AA96ENC9_9VIRU|nr:hypothetical protein MarFTMF_173 [Marseillevirus sp.]
MEEIWRPIPETKMEISSLSRVRDKKGYVVTPSLHMSKEAIKRKGEFLFLDKLFLLSFPPEENVSSLFL